MTKPSNGGSGPGALAGSSSMILTHVVAMTKNRVIGKGGALPWHLPEDLRIFRRLTHGNILIMGRKTFESIGKVLSGRLSIVVSRSGVTLPDGVLRATSIEEALDTARTHAHSWGGVCHIVGGGDIYRQTIHMVDRIHASMVPIGVEGGDAFYPEIDRAEFDLVESVTVDGETGFTIRTYERTTPWPRR